MYTVLHKRAKGNKGENIACEFITNNGFQVIERNYLKKWGELDIVAKKDNTIHFFEVKSVIGEFSEKHLNTHRPEDNVDGWKIKHLRRIIETYLDEKGGGLETPFQFHILCVYMNINTHRARVKWLKNMIL